MKDKEQGRKPDRNDAPIGRNEVKEAEAILDKYKQGKASIDNRATENQEWWKMRHFSNIKNNNAAKVSNDQPASAWLFNSIINKHADIMDNFPKPNILPRDADGEKEAELLSKILPIIFEQNEYEKVYSQSAYDLIIEGGIATSVVWDQSKREGMGDVSIQNVDVHNIFWEPGITDIQESENFFCVSLMPLDLLKEMFPEKADMLAGADNATTVKYIQDDNIDTSNSVEVIDWYYKRTIMTPSAVDEEGNVLLSTPKTIVHLCKYSCGEVLYSSENDKTYTNEGYYRHGMYPFVVDCLFPVKNSVWGFGYLDVMKGPQEYIDRIDYAILRNALMVAEPRYWVRKNADINVEHFLDAKRNIVEVSGSNLGEAVKKIDVDTIPAMVVNYRTEKIDELKETSGNRDFSQGSTQSGVTAASAIAALQEAGSKLARDVNKVCYRHHQKETRLAVEIIRQFYTEPRTFRIDDEHGGYSFNTYSTDDIENENSVFDIKIVAEKQSPFSRAAQNETAKEMYNLGIFNPQMATPASVCLEMMEFEGKDKIKQKISENDMMMQQIQAMQAVIMQADALVPELQLAARAGLTQPIEQLSRQISRTSRERGTAEERAAKKETDTTGTAKARIKASKQAEVR